MVETFLKLLFPTELIPTTSDTTTRKSLPIHLLLQLRNVVPDTPLLKVQDWLITCTHANKRQKQNHTRTFARWNSSFFRYRSADFICCTHIKGTNCKTNCLQGAQSLKQKYHSECVIWRGQYFSLRILVHSYKLEAVWPSWYIYIANIFNTYWQQNWGGREIHEIQRNTWNYLFYYFNA